MKSYTIIGFDAEAYEEPVAVKVESTYDRSIRSYVTILVDANGEQVGDAMFDGTKADRDASVRTLNSRIA